MLQFLIIDSNQEKRRELASELKKASEAIQQYPYINEIDGSTIYDVSNWKRYDATFISISGDRMNYRKFDYPNYIRNLNRQILIVFYSDILTNQVAKYLYEFFPINYLRVPFDSYKVQEIVKRISEEKDPARIFIETKEVCLIRSISEILLFDIKRNIIFMVEKIKVSNESNEYQNYVINKLKEEGFIYFMSRYWINRYWNESGAFNYNKYRDIVVDLKVK